MCEYILTKSKKKKPKTNYKQLWIKSQNFGGEKKAEELWKNNSTIYKNKMIQLQENPQFKKIKL